MNKKIKIIELLNKIANGEELPKSIKYYGFIWQLHNGNYVENGQRMLEDYLANGIVESLNDEVEILEDNTEEIEELPDYNYSIKENRDKINELVKETNQQRKINDEIIMCLKRISDFLGDKGYSEVKNHIERAEYEVNKIRKEKE